MTSAKALSDRTRSTIVALIVSAAFFMENLDGTVIATALPDMAISFNDSAIRLSSGITAYMLTVAIFIPASGWMAARFGTRTVFCGAILLFTLASAACGLATGFYAFLAARIVQGAAAALMSPVGRFVVMRGTEKADILRAAAIVTWPGLIAPVLGPPLGGFITTYASWRWIFFLNIPIGVVGILLALRFMDEHRSMTPSPFDKKGFALTGLSLGALMYGFDRISERDWFDACVFSIAGLALGTAALRHAGRHAHPLVDLSAMRVHSFAVSMWTGILFRVAVGATPILLPLMFQRGFGMTAFASGLLTFAYAFGNIAMKPLTTPILRTFGFRTTLSADALITAFSILLCGLLSPQTPWLLTIVLLVLAGGFRSLGLTGLFTLPFVDIRPEQRGDAATLVNLAQQVGHGLGAAFAGIALQASLLLRGAGEDALTAADFRAAFAAVAAIGLISFPFFWSLARETGSGVSGHKHKAIQPL
jgi:EmrB/QacA subfamily drug resistance transporter